MVSYTLYLAPLRVQMPFGVRCGLLRKAEKLRQIREYKAYGSVQVSMAKIYTMRRYRKEYRVGSPARSGLTRA